MDPGSLRTQPLCTTSWDRLLVYSDLKSRHSQIPRMSPKLPLGLHLCGSLVWVCPSLPLSLIFQVGVMCHHLLETLPEGWALRSLQAPSHSDGDSQLPGSTRSVSVLGLCYVLYTVLTRLILRAMLGRFVITSFNR